VGCAAGREGDGIVASGLVTGTGSFVGASVALALAEEGASVPAHHRSRTMWSDLLGSHDSITVISCDLNHDRMTLVPDGGSTMS
jgi:NAD(P)-dependent dehydrogenase (short-subunit alcohol dehydrogenase family)